MRLHQMVRHHADAREKKRLRQTFGACGVMLVMWFGVIGVLHHSFLSVDHPPGRLVNVVADLEEPDIDPPVEEDPPLEFTEEEFDILWEMYIVALMEDELLAPEDDFWDWLGYYDDWSWLDPEEEP